MPSTYRWIYNQGTAQGRLDYPLLGFYADPGNVLIASAAPDGRWSLADNQTLAETVTRYLIGREPGYVEPGNGHVLVWSDFDNTYIPVAPATHYALFGGFASLDETDPDVLVVGASGVVIPLPEDSDVLVIDL